MAEIWKMAKCFSINSGSALGANLLRWEDGGWEPSVEASTPRVAFHFISRDSNSKVEGSVQVTVSDGEASTP